MMTPFPATNGHGSEFELDELYPLPARTDSVAFPGPTQASAQALITALKHNHEHNHLYFNHLGYHNHSTHHLFTVYALGASPELLKEVYKTHSYQRPAFPSPEPITENNFFQHLGDDKYYTAYLSFFSSYLLTHSSTEALEHFIFAPEYNYIPDLKAGEQPEMLNRLLAGLLHPIIHLAYGLEFGVTGQTAQGLALTAVHVAHQTELVPYSLFTTLPPRFTPNSMSKTANIPPTAKRPTFAFHQKVLESSLLAAPALGLVPQEPRQYENILPVVGPTVVDFVREWSEGWLEGADETEAEERLKGMVEEVAWGNTIWFGIAGWGGRGEEGFNADFFNMHLLTSALFLPMIMLPTSATALDPPLPFSSRLLFLETYLATCTVWHISRGNPKLPIAEFFDSPSTAAFLSAPPIKTTAPLNIDGYNFGGGRTLGAGGPAWPRVFASTLVHENEHLCKAARALAEFDTKWGGREAGYYRAKKGSLEGVEKLDGTLFVRLAGLVTERLGWAAEGAPGGNWDRHGYF